MKQQRAAGFFRLAGLVIGVLLADRVSRRVARRRPLKRPPSPRSVVLTAVGVTGPVTRYERYVAR